jgi:hypothetical protein
LAAATKLLTFPFENFNILIFSTETAAQYRTFTKSGNREMESE